MDEKNNNKKTQEKHGSAEIFVVNNGTTFGHVRRLVRRILLLGELGVF